MAGLRWQLGCLGILTFTRLKNLRFLLKSWLMLQFTLSMWLLIRLLEKSPNAPMIQLPGVLLYEAEIYDQTIADKIRNGLIQHVSVGADYDTLDVVDAKVPHGLFNPELSLVAVPGVPETNVQILEHLATAKTGVEGLEEKDLNLIAEKVASKVSEKDSAQVEKLKTEVSEVKTKLTEAETSS